jgi:hypothetical protein
VESSLSTVKNRTIESNRKFGYRLVRRFMTPAELMRLRQAIQDRRALFAHTSGLGNLGPKYSVIDGDLIRSNLRELVSYGNRKVTPVVEEFASQPLRSIASSKRAIRVQRYQRKSHGFRWHFDGHSYVPLLNSKNSIRGRHRSPRQS